MEEDEVERPKKEGGLEQEEVEEKKKKKEGEERFYDVDMQIDKEMFAGRTSDVVKGKFISFRYTGTYQHGPPVNPRISFSLSSSPLLSFPLFSFLFCFI